MWQHDWIASGVFEEGANSSRHALRCLVPTTIQQLLGAFSSPRQINGNSNSIPGSPGIDIGTAPYCHRLLLRLNPLTPNITCPVAPMQAPPTKHITTTMQPRPSHGGFPGKPCTLSLFPLLLLFSPARNTYLAIPMPLGPINHILQPLPAHAPPTEVTPHLPYTNLLITHKPITVHTLAFSKKEGEEGARPPRPQLLLATHPPVLKPLNLDSSLYSTLNPFPRHQNYTTPPHHRGLPPGAATPPIPPYPWFPQQRWSRLEWARGIGSATLRPPLRRDTVGLRLAATPHLAR